MAFYQPLLLRRVLVVVFATWHSWHMLCRFSGDAGSFRKTSENVTMLRQRSIGSNSQNSILSGMTGAMKG